jgi:ABC-type branched-subunit amino acid transport system substrate-binding protein
MRERDFMTNPRVSAMLFRVREAVMHRFLALLILLFTARSAIQAEPAPPLRVGFIGPFSGAAQIYGDACRNGFDMALGEIAGQKPMVIYEDDGFMPARTVAAFRKLTAQDNVDVIITVGSTPSNAVAPLAQAKGVPLIAWASDQQVARGRPLVIRSYPSGCDEGRRAAEELPRTGTKAALLTSPNDYAASWREGVVKSLSPAVLVFQDEPAGDIRDFRSLILKARERGARSYLLCLDPGTMGLFAKQARELGGAEAFGGCEYLHDHTELENSQGALKGAWFATVPVNDDFRRRYLARFKNESVLSGAANHYDLAHLLAEVPTGSRGLNLVKALIALGPRDGVVGRFAIKDENNDRFFDIPLIIERVE